MNKLATYWRIVRLCGMTVWYSLFGLSFALFDKHHRLFYRHGLNFARTSLRMANIALLVEGEDHLKEGETYVFIANHTSIFDIPAIWVATAPKLGGRLRIIYKRSLQLIPFLGWELMVSPFIPIEREKLRRSVEGLNKAVKAVQEGDSVIIFAEGTRSRSGRLKEFRRGGFHLAARAGKPIVPVAIVGAHKILRADSVDLHAGSIRVIIGKPVPPPDHDDRITERSLMKHVHAVIAAMLPEDQQPL
ncbi:MAG: lysophospholipid acyltransferase family protein [Bacteroidota bacterium]|nr:1-acyl-sn-glycerol-3-phosphate acyltransferase [Candidatus Kapabacteria bacterium]MDW8219518.1 lysophospholipid acyltransferase family protein [Bacteroidota bacterium]